jgi:hypothetical protein
MIPNESIKWSGIDCKMVRDIPNMESNGIKIITLRHIDIGTPRPYDTSIECCRPINPHFDGL